MRQQLHWLRTHWLLDKLLFWRIVIFLPLFLAACIYVALGIEPVVLEGILPLNGCGIAYAFSVGRFLIRTAGANKYTLRRELANFAGIVGVSMICSYIIIDSVQQLMHGHPIDIGHAIFSGLGAWLETYLFMAFFGYLYAMVFNRFRFWVAGICFVVTIVCTFLIAYTRLDPTAATYFKQHYLVPNSPLVPVIGLYFVTLSVTYCLVTGLVVSAIKQRRGQH